MSACIGYRVGATADEAAQGEPGENADGRRNVLVYRNDLVERSETFVVAQATAMQRFRAVFCGLTERAGGILPDQALQSILAGGGRIESVVRKRAFMRMGWGKAWQRRCLSFHPVLLHAHFALDGAFALPLRRVLGIPMIVSLHGYDVTYSDERWNETRGGRLFLQRRDELFAQTRLFLCISEFVREKALERGYPKEKLWMHRVGIDLGMFHSSDEGGMEKEETVLFVGRLVEKKGCAHLIRAMQVVGKSRPSARLVVLGDGPLREHLQTLARNLLPGKHVFLGALSAEGVRNWLQRAMIFCVPSVTATDGNAEGLGMVFCEAQAMGVPVVSSASGGIGEAVEDGVTGFLVPERDEQKLAQKITALMENQALWKQMSGRGRQRMAANFNLKVQTKMLEAKYDEVLAAAS